MKSFKVLALATAVSAVSTGALAELKMLDDAGMQDVTGQAGLTIDVETQWEVGEFAWEDAGYLLIQGIRMGGNSMGNGTGTGGQLLDNLRLEIDIAGSGATPGDNEFNYGFSGMRDIAQRYVDEGNTTTFSDVASGTDTTRVDAAGVDGKNPSEYYQALAKGKNPLIATDEESFNFRMDFTMSHPPLLPWPLYPAFVRTTLARAELNKKIFNDMLATQKHLEEINFQRNIEVTIAGQNLPTLIMWGDEDRVLDVSAAAAFKQLIPAARVHIFEGVGHLPMVEIPNESAEVYQQFLSSIE